MLTVCETVCTLNFGSLFYILLFVLNALEPACRRLLSSSLAYFAEGRAVVTFKRAWPHDRWHSVELGHWHPLKWSWTSWHSVGTKWIVPLFTPLDVWWFVNRAWKSYLNRNMCQQIPNYSKFATGFETSTTYVYQCGRGTMSSVSQSIW
jgi:hypothetical protein